MWNNLPDELLNKSSYNLNLSPQATYNNIQGGYAGEGNLSIDPMFADAELNDFRLVSGSPCIDAGRSTYADFFDFYWNLRYDDPNTEPNTGAGYYDFYDIGAYEYLPEQHGKMEGDMDGDNDIDGIDLSLFIKDFSSGNNSISVESIATSFGKVYDH